MQPDEVKVWLIGENNPYGPDQRFAFDPEPNGSAGWRLCHVILGMDARTYLRMFERRNLLERPKWSNRAAREAVPVLRDAIGIGRVILFGRKVWDAWRPGHEWVPFAFDRDRPYQQVLCLPHPSGRNRRWSDPGAVGLARERVREFAPWLSEFMARPWEAPPGEARCGAVCDRFGWVCVKRKGHERGSGATDWMCADKLGRTFGTFLERRPE